MCPWESSTRSIFGSCRTLNAGLIRRRGPMVNGPNRSPQRVASTGSVTTHTPKKFSSTVECPSHAPVISVSGQRAGSG